MSKANVSLMDVHGALSHLVFAVGQTLLPLNVLVSAGWEQGTYLHVSVECREKDRQMVVDRLSHGALSEQYDYRFSVSHPTGEKDGNAWLVVRAYPDMSHDDKLYRAKGDDQ